MASWAWGRGLTERSSHVAGPTGSAAGGRNGPRSEACWRAALTLDSTAPASGGVAAKLGCGLGVVFERPAFIKPLVNPRGEALGGPSIAASLGGAQAGGGVRQGVVEFGDGIGGDQHVELVEDQDVAHDTPRGWCGLAMIWLPFTVFDQRVPFITKAGLRPPRSPRPRSRQGPAVRPTVHLQASRRFFSRTRPCATRRPSSSVMATCQSWVA